MLPFTFVIINNVQIDIGLENDINLCIVTNTQSYVNILTPNIGPMDFLPKISSLIFASEFLPSAALLDLNISNCDKNTIELLDDALNDPLSLDFHLHIFRLNLLEINYFSIIYRCSNCNSKQFRIKEEVFNYDILPGNKSRYDSKFNCTACKSSFVDAKLKVSCTMICKMSDYSTSCHFELIDDNAFKLLALNEEKWLSLTSQLDISGEIVYNYKSKEELEWLADLFKCNSYFEVAAQRSYLKVLFYILIL